ncbi:MAG: hypothetical protein ONB44_02805 [candidate division KSB1 bacterium]|nr:hypothetical protein [candidate division KSB1 bacterium]MDZ7301055.1 hypothetical protein [candidate division KSB1 bacterium]MDZ7312121.1 hypothetical protein [candidate division KSB1 bacterium]
MSEILAGYRSAIRKQYVWIAIFFALVLVGEMTFDVVERAIGKYLVWQNPSREKIGRSWEAEQQRLAAGVRLENVTRELRRQTMELESISNLEELVQYVETNQHALLPPSQFLQIYRQLPYFLQPLIAIPESLVAAARTQKLANILAGGNRSRFNLIMLDSYNRTIHQASLNADKIGLLINYGKEQNLNVRSAARFSGYLLDPEEFWDLFERLHPLRRRQFIQEVPLLTESAGQITAVGISSQSANEFVEVAFAIADNRACIYYLPEDYVMDLLSPDREKAYQFYRARRQAFENQ